MLKNTSTTYGSLIKFLHWTMAILFVCMFAVAYVMTNISESSFRLSLYDLHKATGILLFGFFAFRLVWRLFNVQPELPNSVPTWQKRAANINIFALYCVMFIMPITGFLISMYGGYGVSFYGIFDIAPFPKNPQLHDFFSDAHEYISYVIIGLVSLHFLGAIHHHWIQRDGVLRRMLPDRKMK